ncbi:MAG: BatD family protein [Woeseiaceae bacterium]|nr:BatD family protein [Woeseiaceae bacterium]
MRLSLLLMLFVAGSAFAQEPRVLVETLPDAVGVGEPLRLRVTVLGPTFFPRAPEWPSFEIANAIVRLPPDSSRSTSQRIDGEMWTGVVRNYEVYPLVAAGFRLDGLTVTVTYADPQDRSPVKVDVAVPPVEFRATVPAGAETLRPYVAGEKLTLSRETDIGDRELEAGDAVVVTYTAELEGMPAMFIPPLYRDAPAEGVSAYADTPVIEDGEVAVRRETVTFVFDSGGEFVLPGAELDWWNRDAGAVDTALVAPVSVFVTGAVAAPTTEALPPYRLVATGVAGLLVLLVAYRILPPWLTRRRQAIAARKRAVLASEQWAFGQLLRALDQGDTYRTYVALTRWLERTDHGLDPRDFAMRYGDDSLVQQVDCLSTELYGDRQAHADLNGLKRGLIAAQVRSAKAAKRSSSPTLQPLNP